MPPPVSRLEQMKADKIPVLMPPNPAPELISRLVEIGLTEQGGMGAVPLKWSELDAWCNRTGVDLPPWEARLYRHLSVEYLRELHKAESEDCSPPWDAPITERQREVELRRVKARFGIE